MTAATIPANTRLASEARFLLAGQPGEFSTFSRQHGRVHVTRWIMAVEAEADRTADGARHVVCQTLITHHFGLGLDAADAPATITGCAATDAPEHSIASFLSTDDHVSVTEADEHGEHTMSGDLGLIRRGECVRLTPNVTSFDRCAVEDQHRILVREIA